MSRGVFEKAAIYCRISKEDEERARTGDDSESIQNQKLLLVDYAKRQGWQVYKIYADDDCSGLYADRPQFLEMLSAAERGAFQIVLCKSQARFSREMETIEKYIHKYFVLWGIRFVGVADHVDTFVAGGKKARQINGLVNEWYSEDLSENVKAALRAKKENGQYLGHWCPYGYLLDPADRHRMAPDPEAAAVVREIFALYLDGHGVGHIARVLTERGIETPTVYKRRKGIPYYNPAKPCYSTQYGVWAESSIRKILADETYIGHLVQGREQKKSFKSRKLVRVPEEDWIVVKNNHEAILKEEVFQRAKALREGRRRRAAFLDGAYHLPHVFAGKAVCSGCKGNMVKGSGKNGVVYLRCGLALKTKGKACSLHTVRYDVLEQAVYGKIQEILHTLFLEEGTEELLIGRFLEGEGQKPEFQMQKKRMDAIMMEQKALSDGLAQGYIDQTRGLLTEEELSILLTSFRKRRRALLQEEALLCKQLARSGEGASQKAKGIGSFLPKDGLTHRMVNSLIDHIEIGERQDRTKQPVTVFWNF